MIVTNVKKIINMLAKEPRKKLFGMCNANDEKGIRVNFELEITCVMLSRARFVSSCSIEVDIIVRVATHTIGKAKNVCVHGIGTHHPS
jgi:hypothetical protein